MMWCNFLLNVLAIFMVEEFYIYAVVQLFFFAGKSVCINQIPKSLVKGWNIRIDAVPRVIGRFVGVKVLQFNVKHQNTCQEIICSCHFI